MLNKKCALLKERFIAPPISTAPVFKAYQRIHGGEYYSRAQYLNKLDFKNFKWSRHDCSSAKQGLGGIQEDSNVAKKMAMCFHFVEGWRF